MTPLSLATNYEGKSRTAFKFAKPRNEQPELAQATLQKNARRMKKWAKKGEAYGAQEKKPCADEIKSAL